MKKHVGMIVHTANRNGYELNVAADSRQVLPQAFLNIFWDEFLAVFGAEYRMQVVLRKRMSHDLSPLPGLDCILPLSHR